MQVDAASQALGDAQTERDARADNAQRHKVELSMQLDSIADRSRDQAALQVCYGAEAFLVDMQLSLRPACAQARVLALHIHWLSSGE